MSPRPNHCPSCLCNDAGPLAVKTARVKAAEYASTLQPGSQLYDYDEQYLGPARDYLPEYLMERGLLLRPRNEGGALVYVIVEQEGNS